MKEVLVGSSQFVGMSIGGERRESTNEIELEELIRRRKDMHISEYSPLKRDYRGEDVVTKSTKNA